jgi:hypothetical protein
MAHSVQALKPVHPLCVASRSHYDNYDSRASEGPLPVSW